MSPIMKSWPSECQIQANTNQKLKGKRFHFHEKPVDLNQLKVLVNALSRSSNQFNPIWRLQQLNVSLKSLVGQTAKGHNQELATIIGLYS